MLRAYNHIGISGFIMYNMKIITMRMWHTVQIQLNPVFMEMLFIFHTFLMQSTNQKKFTGRNSPTSRWLEMDFDLTAFCSGLTLRGLNPFRSASGNVSSDIFKWPNRRMSAFSRNSTLFSFKSLTSSRGNWVPDLSLTGTPRSSEHCLFGRDFESKADSSGSSRLFAVRAFSRFVSALFRVLVQLVGGRFIRLSDAL